MSGVDKAIRARLESVRSNMTAHHAVQQADHGDGRVDAVWNDAGELALAVRDLLDWANGLEKDFEGNPSNVGKAFADQVRTVIATSLGVSGEDRSEPTPAPREQWAVEHPKVNLSAHNSPHSVLYTLSKLPGGRIVVRDAPDRPWRPETRCLCGETKPADRHYTGCPDTSEVVTPAPREPRVWVRDSPDNPPRPATGSGITLRNDNGKTWTQRGSQYFAANAGPRGGWGFGGLLDRCTRLTEVVTPEDPA